MTIKRVHKAIQDLNYDSFETNYESGKLVAIISGHNVEFSERQSSVICAKPVNDESDPMTDYCAWNFYYTISEFVNSAKGWR